MATNGQNAKAIAHAKYSVWVQKKHFEKWPKMAAMQRLYIAHAKYFVWVKKLNCLKHAKNVSTNTLKFFSAKKGSKKQLKYEK